MFQASGDLTAWDCNCSRCGIVRNVHAIVPSASFTLLAGAELLSEYRFGTRVAVHCFCRVCGVTPFYTPRSNPDGVAVTVACLEPGTLRCLTVRPFDGKNWEAAFAATGIALCSRPLAGEVGKGASAQETAVYLPLGRSDIAAALRKRGTPVQEVPMLRELTMPADHPETIHYLRSRGYTVRVDHRPVAETTHIWLLGDAEQGAPSAAGSVASKGLGATVTPAAIDAAWQQPAVYLPMGRSILAKTLRGLGVPVKEVPMHPLVRVDSSQAEMAAFLRSLGYAVIKER